MDAVYTTMEAQSALARAHTRIRRERLLRIFTVVTRILPALGFTPSGITKVSGNRFTIPGVDNPVGFFFEAMYRTGFYRRFLGLCQLAAALLFGLTTMPLKPLMKTLRRAF